MACNCGGKSGSSNLAYLAKGNNGQTKQVSSVTEAKLFLATNGGGTYRAVAK